MDFASLTGEEFLIFNYTHLVECTAPELLTHFMRGDDARAHEIIKKFKDKGYVVASVE